MLRGISEVDMSTTLLGQTVSMPICVAPSGHQTLAHPDGERATAKGKNSRYQSCALLSASDYCFKSKHFGHQLKRTQMPRLNAIV